MPLLAAQNLHWQKTTFIDPLILHVQAGQGTVALVKPVKSLLILIQYLYQSGGGGLIAGVSDLILETNPTIEVIGVEAVLALWLAFEAGDQLSSKKLLEIRWWDSRTRLGNWNAD